MKAHILGNGPSLNLFEPDGEYTIGCNFHYHPVDVSVILDVRPWHVYLRDRSIIQGKPVITSQYAMNYVDIEHELDILYKLPFLEKYQSAAHVAATWCTEYGYSEIHLWGCDAIWADDITTRTDEIVERNRLQHDLYVHWRERWKTYKGHNIIVHNTKEGTPLEELL